MSTALPAYEKLGAFYLGRRVDPATQTTLQEDILLDAKDLTTHALCVGMTGSGKTGLCVGLLEEALIDGVPVIAIDPKGDLSNLLLTFPNLAPSDFRPFLDEGAALRKGLSLDELAKQTAATWRKGLAEWNQGPERIARLREAADMVVYTPGSESVRPLSVLKALSAPSPEAMADREALTERIAGTVSGLLALAGVDADPLTSREHILLTHVLQRAFAAGESMDLGRLVMAIAQPGFDRVGVLDLETFYPERERRALMLRLNGLLASPTFAAWLQGDPLDIDRMLRSESGKPKLTILSIAHLSESERMFFVTLLLSELVAWMRRQSGTGSLRALCYMDEVFGFLPPVQAPPSKQPMLTLLKQARAFGLGMVLATQNPVDVDYKALSNCGTWFLGRLQTARDKERVLDGLEGASSSAGHAFERDQVDKLLSGLGSRRFLMNNVHEDGPLLFQTRWALSYLRGPLTLPQLKLLAERDDAPLVRAEERSEPAGAAVETAPPTPPTALKVRFLASLPGVEPLQYAPALLAAADLHYVSAKRGVDDFSAVSVLSKPLSEDGADWAQGTVLDADALDLLEEPEGDASFVALPMAALREKALKKSEKDLRNHLYQTQMLSLDRCPSLKLTAEVGESRAVFAARVAQVAREARDLEVEKLRSKYGPQLERLQDRIRKAEAKVDKEEDQVQQQSLQTAVNVGTTLLGALFGRRSLGRASTAVRSAGRIAKEKGDVTRAKEAVTDLQQKLAELEAEFEQAVAELEASDLAAEHPIEAVEVRARKGDLQVHEPTLVWLPFRVQGGRRRPAFG